MNGEQRNRRAAVLLIVSSCLWSVQSLPAVFVALLLLWVIVHKRLEGDLGVVLLRQWRRVWPPASVVLIPLLLAATFGLWVSERSVEAKLLPIALNVFALSMIVFGSWWRLFSCLGASRVAPPHGSGLSP